MTRLSPRALFVWIAAACLVATTAATACLNGSPVGAPQCQSCNTGWDGPQCDIDCSFSCPHGNCSNSPSGTGACTVCWPQFYGAGCHSTCTCYVPFGACDNSITATAGTCIPETCRAGFTGVNCDHCANGRWGSNCQFSCTCVWGTCSQGFTGNGACLPGTCAHGYYGKNCGTTKRTRTHTVSRIPPPTTTKVSNKTNATNATSMPTTTGPPLIIAGAVVLRLVNPFTYYNATEVVNAIAAVVSCNSSIVLWQSVLQQTNQGSVSFSINDTAATYVYFGSLIQGVKQADSRLSFMQIASYTTVAVVPATVPVTGGPPVTLPNQSPVSDSGGLSSTTLIIIAIVVVVIIVLGLAFAWFRYKHYLRKKTEGEEIAERAEKRRRENADRAIRGLPPVGGTTRSGMNATGEGHGSDDDDAGGAPHRGGLGNDDGNRRVSFALPKTSIPAEPELAAKATVGRTGGDAFDEEGRYSPTGSEEGPDDIAALDKMVSGYEMKPVVAKPRDIDPTGRNPAVASRLTGNDSDSDEAPAADAPAAKHHEEGDDVR